MELNPKLKISVWEIIFMFAYILLCYWVADALMYHIQWKEIWRVMWE